MRRDYPRLRSYFFILIILKLSIVTSSAGIKIMNIQGKNAPAACHTIKNTSSTNDTISSVTDQNLSDGLAHIEEKTIATIAAAGLGQT